VSRHSELTALRTAQDTDMSQLRARRRAAIKARQRHRRTVVVCALIVAVTLVGADLARGGDGLLLDSGPPASSAAAAAAAPVVADQPKVEAPADGAGTFSYATGSEQPLGTDGAILRYRVAVENGSEYDPATFTGEVDAILGDPRGWAAGKDRRFQRVGEKATAEFTVFLATAGTVEKLCAAAGLHTGRVLSCRLPGQLLINLDRWQNSVSGYGAPLAEYRAFALNHELGHQLGAGHQACAGPRRVAPVMAQQSIDLDGCTANGWPFVYGSYYSGESVP
jgi:hypothetical protein